MPVPLNAPRAFSPNLALFFTLLAAASMLYYHLGLFIPRSHAVLAAQGLGNGYSFGNDFYQVWIAARELQQKKLDPYSAEMTREIQIGLYGRPLDPQRVGDPIDQRGFPYPAFTNLLFWPTALLPFPVARICFVGGLAALAFATVLLWLRALRWPLEWPWITVVVLLVLASYPALEALYAGQLGLGVAFLLVAAIVSLQRERFLLAGTLLALTTVKPQVTALVIVYLMFWTIDNWRVRKKFLLGFLVTMGVLLGTSLAVLPHWIQSWIGTLIAYRRYTRPPLVTEVLTSPLGTHLALPVTLLLTAAALVMALVVAWKNRAESPDSFAFWRALTLLLAITTAVILPGQAVYDHVILVPAILLLARHRIELRRACPAPRALVAVGALVLFWPWMAAAALLTLRPMLTQEAFRPLLSLPIRTAASLPFVVLALLAYTWRVEPFTRRESVS